MGIVSRRAVFLTILLALLPAGEAAADIYVYKDSQGVLHFTNAPTHPGYRPIIRESARRLASLVPDQLEEIIRATSDRHGVDPDLIRAVIKVESDFDPYARSRKGALGLMQLMPETARLHNVNNVYDPDENIDGGVRHLRLLLDRYQGNLSLVLAAYNAGIKAVERYAGIPPFGETRQYVRRVLDYLERYRRNGTASIKEQIRRQDQN